MSPVKKVAIFLIMIGREKGQSIIELMDNSEIKAVVAEIRSLTAISQAMQEDVFGAYKELGYEDDMRPSEILTIMRFLFNDSRISNKDG
ncbi:hypothetical protein [Sporomusa aerivorans]|uniref:hypothetical protein n=1 Tax=Sporomusa aerivorans TaxID=204936 RepID=UPI00352A1335